MCLSDLSFYVSVVFCRGFSVTS